MNKTSKNKKFSLEKFEVAKLKNLRLVKGGDIENPNTGNDLPTITDGSKNCNNGNPSNI